MDLCSKEGIHKLKLYPTDFMPLAIIYLFSRDRRERDQRKHRERKIGKLNRVASTIHFFFMNSHILASFEIVNI